MQYFIIKFFIIKILFSIILHTEANKKLKIKTLKPKNIQVVPMDPMSCLSIIQNGVEESISYRPTNDNVTNCIIASLKVPLLDFFMILNIFFKFYLYCLSYFQQL